MWGSVRRQTNNPASIAAERKDSRISDMKLLKMTDEMDGIYNNVKNTNPKAKWTRSFFLTPVGDFIFFLAWI